MSENSSNCCCCSSDGCRSQPVPVIKTVSAKLSFKDRLGGLKVRWGIGRMNYTVEPGIYAVGDPDENAPVLVSANYKLTFDSLRKELSGVDCRLLILNTKGVNVWCSAGKGTFGTDELINRIADTQLNEIVSHKILILPQLGASGINADEVKKRSGFTVVYGPVRARDVKTFLKSGNKATDEMRTVKFTIRDRLILTPMELVPAFKKSLVIFGVIFLLNLFAAKPFGLADFIAYAGAVFAGAFMIPVLLPFIPGRAFSFKGGLIGLLWAMGAIWLNGWVNPLEWLPAIGYLLVLPSVSAYLSMNFTGSSTYTSPSGVLKEMKIALPLMITASMSGSVLILLSRVLGL